MKKIAFILTCSFFLTVSGARAQYQPYPDSIRVEYADHKSTVTFQLKDFVNNVKPILQMPSMLGELLIHLQKSIPADEWQRPHNVMIRELSQEGSRQWDIRVEEAKPATTLTVRESNITELLPPGWNISVVGSGYRIDIYSPGPDHLTQVLTEDPALIVTAVRDRIAAVDVKRKGIHARLVMENHSIAHIKEGYSHPADMLGLHAGAAAGVFRDKLYPEINLVVALYFNNRNRVVRQRLEFGYETKFFSSQRAEGGFRTMPNSFATFSYSRNFSRERPRFTGIGVGYLVQSNGDLYQGRTMKFFLESDIGSRKLNLVPEFYLTGDLKKFAFGLKVNYKF